MDVSIKKAIKTALEKLGYKYLSYIIKVTTGEEILEFIKDGRKKRITIR